MPVAGEEAIHFPLLWNEAAEDLHVGRHALKAQCEVFGGLHRDVADLGEIDRAGPHVGGGLAVSELAEKRCQCRKPEVIRLLDLRLYLG